MCDVLINKALKAGLLCVNAETGEVFGSRWAKTRTRGCKNTKGYVVFTLHLDGLRCQAKAHRTIWIAVHGAIPSNMAIDHINGIKHDNRIANLRLATAKLNSSNRRRYNGEGNPASILNKEKVNSIRTRYASVKSYSKLAVEFGVSKSLIAQIIRRELWT